jgi:mannosyltransferase
VRVDERVAAPTSGDGDRHAPSAAEESPFAGTLGRLFAVAVVAVVVVSVVLRFVVRSPLWEDEALTVAIARRPLGQLRHLLEHDGSPPVFYVLLHFWIKVLGSGKLAVRSLSGVIGVATLPAAYYVGRRVGGHDRARGQWIGWAAVLIVATSPYAFRYSTEVRMYQLAALLVLLGYLAVANALEQPTIKWLAAVAVVTAALLYTTYWTFYVLIAVGVVLLVRVRRDGLRSPAGRTLAGVGVGCLTFVPWLPTFAYQSRHTGTPWALRVNPLMAGFRLVLGFAGQRGVASYVLVALLVGLVLLGLFGVAVDSTRTELDWRTRPHVRWAAYVTAATVVIGLSLAYVGIGAAAIRYPAIIFGLFAVVAAAGVVTFGNRMVRYALLGVVVASGLVGGYHNAVRLRTQANQVARAVNAAASPGDAVVYCPDQLGLDANRLMRSDIHQYAFPTLGSPEIIDWVDYARRNREFHGPGVSGNLADPATFAAEVVRRAGPTATIWYAWSDGYKTFGDKCGLMVDEFRKLRPRAERIVRENLTVFESENLHKFSP